MAPAQDGNAKIYQAQIMKEWFRENETPVFTHGLATAEQELQPLWKSLEQTLQS